MKGENMPPCMLGKLVRGMREAGYWKEAGQLVSDALRCDPEFGMHLARETGSPLEGRPYEGLPQAKLGLYVIFVDEA